jgi:hypothetical protein
MARSRLTLRPQVEALEDRHLPGSTSGWIIRQDGGNVRAIGVRLTFNQALDLARATDAGNYTLEGSDGKRFRPIPVRQAVFNPDKQAVRLLWRQPATLLTLRKLRVTVHGDPPGVANTGGQLLDGNQDGTPGGDAVVLLRPRPGHTVRVAADDAGVLRLLAAKLL